jgi:hypothetical protein
MFFDHLAIFLPGQGMENLPQLLADFPKQSLPPSLRDEHDMVFGTPISNGIGSDKGSTFTSSSYIGSHLAS